MTNKWELELELEAAGFADGGTVTTHESRSQVTLTPAADLDLRGQDSKSDSAQSKRLGVLALRSKSAAGVKVTCDRDS